MYVLAKFQTDMPKTSGFVTLQSGNSKKDRFVQQELGKQTVITYK